MKDHIIADRAFLRGVACALAVVQLHGADTIFDEIVGTVCAKELVRIARADGCLKWSGLAEWRRRQKKNRGTASGTQT